MGLREMLRGFPLTLWTLAMERIALRLHRGRSWWLRILLVAGTLLLCARIGYRPPLSPFLMAAGLAALLLAWLASRSMGVVLTLLIAASPVVEFSLSTGTQSPVHLSLLLVALCMGVWILRMLLQRDMYLAPCAANRPLLLFNLAVLISWIAGYAIWSPTVPQPGNALFVQAGQVAMFVLSTAAFLLTANHPLREQDAKRWNAIIIVIGLVGVAGDILPLINRPAGVKGGMLMWPFVLLWAQLLFNPNLSRRLRAAGWLSLPLWGYWIWTSAIGWKSAWVPALLALTVLLLLRSRPAFVLFVVLVVLLVALNWESVFPATYLPEEQGGSLLRPAIWFDVLRITARSPILGLGPANYMYYWRDPTFSSYSIERTNWWAWVDIGYAPPSHNMFVDVIAQTGLLGLALFLWAIAALVRLANRIRQHLPAGFLGAYAQGVFAGFVALLIASFSFADWLIPFVYNITIKGFQHSVYSWLLLGSLVPLLQKYGPTAND